MKKFLIVIATITVTCNYITAQDIHFSQYKQVPLLINPALTGDVNGDWRAGIHFRKQWTNTAVPYETFNGFFDKKFFLYSKVIMAGANIMLDQTFNKGLTKVYIAPSFAYALNYKKNNFVVGFQPGFSFYSVDSRLTHPDQFSYESGKFDNQIPTEDLLDNNYRVFPDIGIGATWSRKIKNLQPRVGLSFYHINRPKNSIYSNANDRRVPVKTVVNAELPLKVNREIQVVPSLLLTRQRSSQEFLVGGDAAFAISEKSEGVDRIYAGLHYRDSKSLNDGFSSIVIIGGVRYYNFKIMISYDEYVNAAKKASPVGSTFEISIIYTGINTITDKFSIPCEIY